MIEPIWLQADYPEKYQGDTYFETCLRLPLNTKNKDNFDKLCYNLEEVYDENLMLFLNKLECMVFDDRCLRRQIRLERIKLGENWTKILSNRENCITGDGFWFIRRKIINPNMRRVADDDIIKSTTVAVAMKFIVQKDSSSAAASESKEFSQLPTSLCLDVTKRLPLYAFLPTKTAVFQFIVQGDFVLSSSREFILEDNEWNQCLLDFVPGLFVQVVRELSAAAWNIREGKPASEWMGECPNVCELYPMHELCVHMQDILDILPRISNCTSKVYVDMTEKIYKLLQTEVILWSGANRCIPTKLVYTPSLPEIENFVSEDLLSRATGYRYLRLTGVIHEDILKGLGIQKFGYSIICDCISYINDKYCSDKSTNSFTDGMWSELCGCLLALEVVSASSYVSYRPTKTKTNAISIQKGMLIPSSQLLYNWRTGTSNVDINRVVLPTDIIKALKKLCIWPTADNEFVSLDKHTVFMPADHNAKNATRLQKKCIDSFNIDSFRTLHPRLLSCASILNGDAMMRGFLTRNFKTNLSSSGSGGIEELTPIVVLRKIILPAYQSANCLDRTTAAAFLAFTFSVMTGPLEASLHDIKSALKDHGVVVPVVTARERSSGGGEERSIDCEKRTSKFRWVSEGRCVCIGGKSACNKTEVHLGVEFKDSATSQLAALPVSTALRQIEWLIVDPLVASYFFEVSQLNIGLLQQDRITHDTVQAIFKDVSGDLPKWRSFLLDIGVVNFFGVKDDSGPTGGLELFLQHLLRNKIPYSTKRHEHIVDESSTVSERKGARGYIPLFLPSPNEQSCVYQVTSDVHRSLQVNLDTCL